MDTAILDETSQRFLGKWKRLVSTTNWDKGRIICEWREALIASGAASTEYSDETWSQNVGNVTPQHVGRLRRAFERFGQVADDYAGLYWSHFQAALDWDDAEMWLEGAVQNNWSISEMRNERWETLGGLDAPPPDDAERSSTDWDEDADASEGPADADAREANANGLASTSEREQHGDGAAEGPDYPRLSHPDDLARGTNASTATEPIRPFARLPVLPDDVSEAFESFKLCILRHKIAGWQEISCDDILTALDALKELALAPTLE